MAKNGTIKGGEGMITAVVRTIILYLLIILGIRLMGKRQIGELEPSELVLSLIIADLAAVPMQDFGIPLIMGIIPILTLLCLSAILSVLTVKSIRFRALLCSRPSIVIQDGKILTREMVKNRFTVDELMEELRMAGVTDLSTVKYAVLETTGRISVLPYAEHQPVTVRDMGLKVKEAGLPVIVVSDGRVLSHNLKTRNLSMRWVKEQMGSRGVQDIRQVFLMTVDEADNVYFVKKLEAALDFCGDLSWYGAPSVLEHGPCASADGTHAGRPVPSGCSGAGGGLAEGRGTDPKGTGALAE